MVASTENSTELVGSARRRVLLPGPIAFVLVPQFTSIAFSAAVESLRIANRYLSEKYQWVLLSIDGQPVPDGNGLPVTVHGSIDQYDGRLGSAIVIADLSPERYADAPLGPWLKRQAAQGTTIGGIDTAAYILARNGLLTGRRATLHWENAPTFRELHPNIEQTENLFEFDRGRVTCAGGTAAIDMMLYAIESQHGHEVAVRVAEHFMHQRIRNGSEHQRFDIPERFGVHHPKLVQAIQIMEEAIEEPLEVSELADIIGVSERQLLRLFKTHLNSSPAKLYLNLRLDRARRLLTQSDLSVIDVAMACGFQSHSHFSRVYRNRFGRPPQSERRATSRRQTPIVDVPTEAAMR